MLTSHSASVYQSTLHCISCACAGFGISDCPLGVMSTGSPAAYDQPVLALELLNETPTKQSDLARTGWPGMASCLTS